MRAASRAMSVLCLALCYFVAFTFVSAGVFAWPHEQGRLHHLITHLGTAAFYIIVARWLVANIFIDRT